MQYVTQFCQPRLTMHCKYSPIYTTHLPIVTALHTPNKSTTVPIYSHLAINSTVHSPTPSHIMHSMDFSQLILLIWAPTTVVYVYSTCSRGKMIICVYKQACLYGACPTMCRSANSNSLSCSTKPLLSKLIVICSACMVQQIISFIQQTISCVHKSKLILV